MDLCSPNTLTKSKGFQLWFLSFHVFKLCKVKRVIHIDFMASMHQVKILSVLLFRWVRLAFCIYRQSWGGKSRKRDGTWPILSFDTIKLFGREVLLLGHFSVILLRERISVQCKCGQKNTVSLNISVLGVFSQMSLIYHFIRRQMLRIFQVLWKSLT